MLTTRDKAIIERTFSSINTLFCQHVSATPAAMSPAAAPTSPTAPCGRCGSAGAVRQRLLAGGKPDPTKAYGILNGSTEATDTNPKSVTWHEKQRR
jgi:hypothetical protein